MDEDTMRSATTYMQSCARLPRCSHHEEVIGRLRDYLLQPAKRQNWVEHDTEGCVCRIQFSYCLLLSAIEEQ